MKSKGLFQSKTFWVALIGLGIAVYNVYSMHDFPPELQEKIANLDWSNITAALLNVLIIIIRWWFTDRPIKGFWKEEPV